MSSSAKKSSRSGSSSKPSSGSKSGSKSGSGSKSSSKYDHRNRSRAPQGGDEDELEGGNEGEWADWEWDEKNQREWRSRLSKDGQWEYDFYYPRQDTTPAENVPRRSELGHIQDEPEGEISFPPMPSQDQPPRSPSELGAHYADVAQPMTHQADPQQRSLSRNFSDMQFNSEITPDDNLDYEGVAKKPYIDSGEVSPNPLRYTFSVPSPAPGEQYTDSSLQSDSSAIPRKIAGLSKPSQQLSLQRVQSGSTETSDRYISGRAQGESGAASTDALHKSYKVYPSKNFKFGEVFKMEYAEPKGQGLPGNAKRTIIKVIKSKLGEDFYISIRRFVIIRENQGHSLCLPIFTYGGQGTSKPGVKPHDHSIIYIEEKGKKGEVPKEAPEEVKLMHKPIRMEPRTSRDQLDRYSRLNYAKIYTVEHNVKVCFIGAIHKKSLNTFIRSYNFHHQPIPEDDSVEYDEDAIGEQPLRGRDIEASNAQELRDTGSQVEETATGTI